MDPERFWQLVDLLGGVADDTSTPRLDAVLQETDETHDFLVAVGAAVTRLLARCPVPASHGGDTAEWIAASVIAAGRETYERTLTAGGGLDPDGWDWGEAENLLVAGMTDDRDADEIAEEELGGRVGLHLEWKTTSVPDGVTSNYDPETDWFGDDPRFGHTIVHDPDWVTALGRLDEDAEFHRRRATIGNVGLHVVVREVSETELVPWPSADAVENVVLLLPASLVSAAESRVDAYLEALVTLVASLQDQAGDS
ncbi:MAG: hypothetical protein JWO11_1678 [Nocardioides sp.]|nr:hypothetical protein [Nocardioides sp.]